MAAVKKIFNLFVQRMPTTFIIQDTGDNAVLVATSPTNLTAKKLGPIGNDIEHLQGPRNDRRLKSIYFPIGSHFGGEHITEDKGYWGDVCHPVER